jgi:hypothetical protein
MGVRLGDCRVHVAGKTKLERIDARYLRDGELMSPLRSWSCVVIFTINMPLLRSLEEIW